LPTLTTKSYTNLRQVKIGNSFFAPIPDPQDKIKIAENTKLFFTTLPDSKNTSPHDIYISAGDFDSHTGTEKKHHPDLFPESKSLKWGTPKLTSCYKKRTGRSQIENSHCLVRDRTYTNTGNPIRTRTIVDYFTINKYHWARMTNCTVHAGSWMNIRYIAHVIDTRANPCDYELLTLLVEISTLDTPDG
jgi:hypothetical protein